MPFLRKHWTLLALGIVLLVGGWMRLTDPNFDQNTHQHPDERAITGWVMSRVQIPFPAGTTLADVLNPLKSPINMRVDPASKEPQDMHYGTLPFYIIKVVAVIYGNVSKQPDLATDYNGLVILGRSVSGVFDLFTVFLVFLIGRRLYGKHAGLLAATFSALAVMQIQTAHFMIAEPYLVAFLTAALYFSVVLMQNRRAWAAALAGLMLGFALACKISVAFMALLIVAALVVRVAYQAHTRQLGPPAGLDDPYGLEPATRAERQAGPNRAAFRALALLILAGVMTLAGFTLGDPLGVLDSGLHVNINMADPNTTGTTFFHLGPVELWAASGKYLYQLGQEASIQNGSADRPFTRQYIGTTPVLYHFQQVIQWGMGPASGLVALAGLLWAFWLAFRRRRPAEVLLLAGMIPYFLTIVNLEAKWLRYMLPLVPYMCVLAGGLLVQGLQWSAGALTRIQALREARRPAQVGLLARRWVFPLVTVGSLVGSLLWAIAFMNIYTQDESRVQASRWMNTHLSADASYGHEVWDDEVPFGVPGTPQVSSCPGPRCISMDLYPDKSSPDEFEYIAGLLDKVDYIVPASNRLYDSIPRLPWRYPVQTRYYELLFAGKLGFDKIYEEKVYPELTWLGIRFDDSRSDESFTVYDHPKVSVFKKVRSLSREDLRVLFGSSSLDRPSIPVSHLESKDPSNYDKSLLLPQPTGQQLALDDTAWNPLAQNQWVAALLWLLLIELIGWLAWPLVAVVCRRLPDRGFPLAKTLGLVVVSWITWMTASLRLFPFTVWSILLGVLTLALISAVLWRKFGSEIRAYMRTHRRLILAWEGLFLVAFAFFLFIRLLDPDSWHLSLGGEKPMELGFLNSVLRSPWMPPGDPFFSSGYINYYYYGWFLLSILIKGIGVTSAVGFNLSFPMLYGLTVLGAASIVYNAVATLQRARGWRGAGSVTAFGWGLAGAVLLVGIGNLNSMLQAISMKLPAVQQALVRTLAFFGPVGGAVTQPAGNFDYWSARSIIPGTINEFPFWTFLFADLHPHLIDLSIVVLSLGLIFNMLLGAWRWPQFRRLPQAILDRPVAAVPAPGLFARADRPFLPTLLEAAHRLWGSSPGDGALRLAVVSLSLGTLFAVNSWDFPVYLVVLFGALLVAVLTAWHSPAVQHGVVRLSTVGGAVIGLGLAAALGIIWYAPFILNFKPFFNQIKITQPEQQHTQLSEFLVMWGLFLLIGFTYLALRLRQYPWGEAFNDWRRWLHLGSPTPSAAFAAPLPTAATRATVVPLSGRSLARVTLTGDRTALHTDELATVHAATTNGHTASALPSIYAADSAGTTNGHSDGSPPPTYAGSEPTPIPILVYANGGNDVPAESGHGEAVPALVYASGENDGPAENGHGEAVPALVYANEENTATATDNDQVAAALPLIYPSDENGAPAENGHGVTIPTPAYSRGENDATPALAYSSDEKRSATENGHDDATPALAYSSGGNRETAAQGRDDVISALAYSNGETDGVAAISHDAAVPAALAPHLLAEPAGLDDGEEGVLARSRREWLAAMDDYEYAAPTGAASGTGAASSAATGVEPAPQRGFPWNDPPVVGTTDAAGTATLPLPQILPTKPQAGRGLIAAGLGLPILALTLVITGLLIAGGHALPAMLALLIGGLIGTHFGGVRAPGALLGGLLLTVGFAIALGVEYVYLADHLQGGDAYRMNTVFKFYEQVWVLVAAGGAIALYAMLGPQGSARRGGRSWFSPARAIWLLPFGVLLAGSLLFTVVGTQARVADRMPGERPPLGTLNAMDWMNGNTSIRVEFGGDVAGTLIFRFERPALDWMNAHIKGTPVVAAAPVGYYRESGMMVGTYTGLPMVVGGLHQDEQRYGWQVGERRGDMDQFYQTTDISRTLLLINKYDIEYIYIGGVERIRYGHDNPAALDKFDAMTGPDKYLEKVFDEGNHVVVYHVRAQKVKTDLGGAPGTVFVAPTPVPRPTEPPLGDDPVLNGLLKTLQGDPNNLDAHHALGDYYRDHGVISKAIDQYIEIVRLTPADVPAHHLLGDLYMQVGERDKALAAWEEATKNAAEPDKPAAFNKVGIAYLERQRFDDAINAFKAVTAADHQYAEGWFHLGEAYQAKGDTSNARDAFTQCINNARPDESGKHWAAEAKRRLDNLR